MGILLGIYAPNFAIALKPLSDGFLRLIDMIISPLVFCVVVQGIAGAENLLSVGRIGLKALLYFETMMLIALLFGLCVTWIVGPGRGMHIDLSAINAPSIHSYN